MTTMPVAYTAERSLVVVAFVALGLAVFGYLQNGAGRVVTAVPGWLLFGPLALVIWTLMHASGVHATIAGADSSAGSSV